MHGDNGRHPHPAAGSQQQPKRPAQSNHAGAEPCRKLVDCVIGIGDVYPVQWACLQGNWAKTQRSFRASKSRAASASSLASFNCPRSVTEINRWVPLRKREPSRLPNSLRPGRCYFFAPPPSPPPLVGLEFTTWPSPVRVGGGVFVGGD